MTTRFPSQINNDWRQRQKLSRVRAEIFLDQDAHQRLRDEAQQRNVSLANLLVEKITGQPALPSRGARR